MVGSWVVVGGWVSDVLCCTAVLRTYSNCCTAEVQGGWVDRFVGVPMGSWVDGWVRRFVFG